MSLRDSINDRKAARPALFLKLYCVYPVANLLYMVKSIKQRMAVDSHPQKQLMQVLIGVEDIGGTDLMLSSRKTDRFMMRYSVSEDIDAVKFIEHIGIVVLDFCGRTRLVREYS